MNEPKFKIGDTLTYVTEDRFRFFVVGVIADKCPGGTQHCYDCRLIDWPAIGKTIITLNETELMEIPPKATLADRLRELKNIALEAGDMELASQIRESEKRITGK